MVCYFIVMHTFLTVCFALHMELLMLLNSFKNSKSLFFSRDVNIFY